MIAEKTVHDNLNSAMEGGYGPELSVMSVEEIAADLIAFAEDCEECTADELKPHIESWLAKARTTNSV